MIKLLKILLIIITLTNYTYAGIGDFFDKIKENIKKESNSNSKEDKDYNTSNKISSKLEPIENYDDENSFSPTGILTLWESNKGRFERKYTGKRIIIKGRIDQIDENSITFLGDRKGTAIQVGGRIGRSKALHGPSKFKGIDKLNVGGNIVVDALYDNTYPNTLIFEIKEVLAYSEEVEEYTENKSKTNINVKDQKLINDLSKPIEKKSVEKPSLKDRKLYGDMILDAAKSPDVETLKEAVLAGGMINIREDGSEANALFRIVVSDSIEEKEKVEIVRFLLEYGADPKANYAGTATCLLSAARRGNIEVCKLLVRAGASVEDLDEGYYEDVEEAFFNQKPDIPNSEVIVKILKASIIIENDN